MALAFPVGSDYDFDVVQPYFLSGEEEEEFFPPPRSQLLPGPGEDIWKKFELLPTPPLSPSRTPPQSGSWLSWADHLEAVWDLLDEGSSSSSSLLQSFIIQDCMWSSSFAAAAQLEQMVSDRLASLQTRRDSSETSGVPDLDPGPQVIPEDLQELHAAPEACVDPSAVFSYATPTERQRDDDVAMEAESELSLESPPLSSDCDSGGSQAFILKISCRFRTIFKCFNPDYL